MTLLVVGSMAIDSVETPFGKRPEALGGSATFFSMSASLLTPVRLVAVIGNDFPEEHVEMLKTRKIDLSGLERVAGGKTFRWAGKYGDNLNEAITLDTQLNVFAEFKPKLPEHFKDTPYVFLANIHPALQLDVLKQIRSPKLVGLDTMNLWINIERPALLEVVKRIDVLTLNETEAKLLSGEPNVARAAKAIKGMGPRVVIVKRGEYGALYFDGEHVFHAPAYPLEQVFDPTGAGDTFAGGMMGWLARTGGTDAAAFRQAMIMGCVLGSFTVEAFSVDRLKQVTNAELHRRFQAFRSMTYFDELPRDFV
jgi:sugar/nucleoside kinase (ribokinase family)